MTSLQLNTFAAASLLLAAGSACAQAGTASLAGWQATGDVVAQGGAITLTTAYLDGAGDQPFNLSGTSAVDYSALAAAAGLPVQALDVGGQFVFEGSLVSQSFSVAAGQQLRFDWAFSSRETDFLDHAFVVLDGRLHTLATTAQPGAATQGFSAGFAQAGTVTLAFGVADTEDVLGVSSLTITNLAVSAVPEPATSALLLAGLGLLATAARRRAQGVR